MSQGERGSRGGRGDDAVKHEAGVATDGDWGGSGDCFGQRSELRGPVQDVRAKGPHDSRDRTGRDQEGDDDHVKVVVVRMPARVTEETRLTGWHPAQVAAVWGSLRGMTICGILGVAGRWSPIGGGFQRRREVVGRGGVRREVTWCRGMVRSGGFGRKGRFGRRWIRGGPAPAGNRLVEKHQGVAPFRIDFGHQWSGPVFVARG